MIKTSARIFSDPPAVQDVHSGTFSSNPSLNKVLLSFLSVQASGSASKLFIRPRRDNLLENGNWGNGDKLSSKKLVEPLFMSPLLPKQKQHINLAWCWQIHKHLCRYILFVIWIICAVVVSQPDHINNLQQLWGISRRSLVCYFKVWQTLCDSCVCTDSIYIE